MHECETPAKLLAKICSRKKNETEPDQWQVQILARIMSRHRVILVCDAHIRSVAQEMKFEIAETLEQAFILAEEEKGAYAHVVVIPDGVSIIVDTATVD